jgi:cellulose synthase operon protein YhjQ
MRRRTLAGPQPVGKLPGEISDPYVSDQETAGRILALAMPEQDMRPTRFPHTRDARQMLPKTDGPATLSGTVLSMEAKTDLELPMLEQVQSAGNGSASGQSAVEIALPVIEESVRVEVSESKAAAASAERNVFSTLQAQGSISKAQSETPKAQSVVSRTEMPAWLATPQWAERKEETAVEESPVGDTLQQSREKVASRWFALRGLFDQGVQEQTPETQPSRHGEVPVLAVFSLAGGVGKTSLVATLGRALASSGEKVLLTDTTSHGLLPFYFGATELRPGVVRTFAPPIGSADAPVHLVSFDLREKVGDLEAQEELAEELTRDGQGMQRVLIDLSPLTPWVARRLARMNTTIVVPLAPDLSSIISLTAVEKFFADIKDANDQPVHPYYLLNGFDASQPLHLDVREVLRQQLGERLLPFVIRRSPAVAEALAEGMTVMDYAPESPVAQDFMNLASWLRTHSAPAPGFRKVRWSEQ